MEQHDHSRGTFGIPVICAVGCSRYHPIRPFCRHWAGRILFSQLPDCSNPDMRVAHLTGPAQQMQAGFLYSQHLFQGSEKLLHRLC